MCKKCSLIFSGPRHIELLFFKWREGESKRTKLKLSSKCRMVGKGDFYSIYNIEKFSRKDIFLCILLKVKIKNKTKD